MTSSLDMIRGRQVVQTLTNQSGGAIIAGDVVIVSAANDESFTTTTSAAYNSTRVGVALESIASAAAGRILLEGYAPLVNVSASATRGHYLLTHTVAKQATSQAGYAAGAFGQILKAGTTPSAMIFPVAQVGSAGVTRSGSTTGDHLAVWNGSNADSIKDGGAVSSGGNVTTTSAFASPPTPASGDVWFPNNSFYLLRYSGSAEIPWGPIFPLTAPPAASDFTWENQNTATVAETNGGIVMNLPGTVTGANTYDLRNLYKSATAPYTITACFLPTLTPVSYRGYHLGFRNSSSGSIVTFGIYYDATNGLALSVRKWTSATLFSANYTATNNAERFINPAGPIWLRIADDNSNRICSYSNDGINFVVFHSVGRTDFITADQVLWGGFTQTTGSDTNYISLISWA